MPANTPIYNLPYPVATDLVINGPATIQSLAETVETVVNAVDTGSVPTSRTVSAGNGLTGGGSLSGNITLAADFGTTANTITVGNDSRIVNAVQNTRQVIAGSGLNGGGDLSTDRTLSVDFGTGGTQAAAGNDTRIVNAVQNTRQVIAGSGLSGGGALSSDATLSVDFSAVASNAALTGAFAPLDQRLWIGAAEFGLDGATLDTVAGAAVVSMPETADSYAVSSLILPDAWQSVQLIAVWANGNSGSGDVVWRFSHGGTDVGANLAAITNLSPDVTDTAGVQDIVLESVSSTVTLGTSRTLRVKVTRMTSDAGDTLPNEAYLVGVIVERVS